MIWGVIVGTYSSIFVAAPILITMGMTPGARASDKSDAAEADKQAS